MEIIEKNGLRSILQKIKNLYGGGYGVISQTQTWSKDADGRYGYTMSKQVRGYIPQANIDLFINAGAEFNDTDAPITKTAPWNEQVQHLPGYFYLNGLGDISYQEMMNIYTFSNQCGYSQASAFKEEEKIRTLFPLKGTGPIEMSERFMDTFLESFVLTDKSNRYIGGISMFRAFGRCRTVKYAGPIDGYSITNFSEAFSEAYSLRRCILYRLRASISFQWCKLLDLYSIAFMIKNAQTQTIVITLHPDTYARVYINGDASQGFTQEAIAEGIDTALATKTNVTLASA